MPRKITCSVCLEDFELTKEQQQNYDEGFIELPKQCMECFSNEQGMYATDDTDGYGNNFSDADPGL